MGSSTWMGTQGDILGAGNILPIDPDAGYGISEKFNMLYTYDMHICPYMYCTSIKHLL